MIEGGQYSATYKSTTVSNANISDTCLQSIMQCQPLKYMELKAATIATEPLLRFRLFVVQPVARDLYCSNLLPSPNTRALVAAMFPCFMRRFAVVKQARYSSNDEWVHRLRRTFVFARDSWSERIPLLIRKYGWLPYQVNVGSDKESVTVKFSICVVYYLHCLRVFIV